MASRVFIIRHGEREDWVDRRWSRESDRPQDPSLTQRGKLMAHHFGQYLGKRAGKVSNGDTAFPPISLDRIEIFSSPLTRCVETSHSIAEGLGRKAPIHIEDSLVEGMQWVHGDLARRHEYAARPQAMTPLWYDADHHKENTSPLVSNHRSFHPVKVVYPHGALDETMPYWERCARGAEQMLQSALFTDPQYHGTTVILVAHGATTVGWYSALTQEQTFDDDVPYTGFVELWRTETSRQRDGLPLFIEYGQVFETPHLDSSLQEDDDEWEEED